MSISSIASQASQALGGLHAHHHGKASASGAPAGGGSIIDQIASQLTGNKAAAPGSGDTGLKLPGVGAALTQLGSDLLGTLNGLVNGAGTGSTGTAAQGARAYAASSALGG